MCWTTTFRNTNPAVWIRHGDRLDYQDSADFGQSDEVFRWTLNLADVPDAKGLGKIPLKYAQNSDEMKRLRRWDVKRVMETLQKATPTAIPSEKVIQARCRQG